MRYLSFLLLFTVFSLQAQQIKHTRVDDLKSQYFIALIELALAKANVEQQFSIIESSQNFNQQQQVERIKNGELSIMWAGTQPDYEHNLLPIRIPLMKGLQGHRLFIIRPDQQAAFSKVDSLSALKTLKAGQGRFWGDTEILKFSGLPVVTSVKKENLFYMLEGGRFDYFPLAVHEPWDEVLNRPTLGLMVEKHILLVYPMAMYFFVSRDNPDLHRLIVQGLEQAIADGSFDELFYNAPHIKNALKLAKLSQRQVIRIPNPTLTEQTPLKRKALWLNLENQP
ncbi:diguanylate cyclase [Catenovulum adriaticum]|uniref:Transporter substrate-binding domain-containing protein n=1 Tax=Catenovulum adriaticum TaxID=2984846 RepID=A0ABY7AQ66_9ALTE|nr:diguanylate cyclase [Catenovulum sp. TS8]WAJ70600.1 transporter substrate-binding domain-containing protein [Catenovulum sp. TS8]